MLRGFFATGTVTVAVAWGGSCSHTGAKATADSSRKGLTVVIP